MKRALILRAEGGRRAGWLRRKEERSRGGDARRADSAHEGQRFRQNGSWPMLELDVQEWAEQQFGACELGDQRRTARAVRYAAQAAADPDSSTPAQTERWSDLKAAYRLFDREEVTFAGLAEPHWQLTRASCASRQHVLLLDDTTDVCFNNRAPIDDLGIIGDEQHQGFLLHSALAVEAMSGEILGMAAQTIRHRRPVKKEHARERLKRKDRESRLWSDVITLVGAPAEGVVYTHVCDRGADNFEVYCHLLRQGAHWIVRAAQLTRVVQTAASESLSLKHLLAALPRQGSYQLAVRGSAKQVARVALLEVRFAAVTMPRPKMTSGWVKECGPREIPMYVVEVREVLPPSAKRKNKFEPLHWVLLTSHPVQSFEDAFEVVDLYEQRPLIEEYHKALKTGCRLEARQYATAPRLEAVTGILAVVAVRLLQLKTVAQQTPDLPVLDVVPRKWAVALRHVRKREIETARQFFRELAGLGGFLGRRHDGEPGWQTLWRGFEKLHTLLRGAEALAKECG